ncbi:site-specific DNA recombinase [Keratinibaculum paraultunense]|uniref:Site-specific DNA recombinase n=1 Tax=Keratinibaculum paraultunense TaxID=1278232 RepID=A0A4R3L3V9_9FIRM|nr:recombinase family protein [Keratinibaculum paraultunense]TCS91303.1 site-specific DNA recombinase [Keratinibaculum paraultunense]
MKIAIYSRKSKYTGKGESIQNQIEMCKDYCNKHFDQCEFIIYEDEGFSGGDKDRPQFKSMMSDAKKGKFETVVCYRLDRISRNVLDFSQTLEELNNKNISFISINEQFDTSTPIGRAMTYIATVFAQLERETIAERIRDNMIQLAKTGRWLGGVTPTGFDSKEVIYIDPSGKERKMFKLTPIPEEIKIIRLIYSKFLELDSLTQLETFCIQNDIKTKNGNDYTRFTLRSILTNPVYATADEDTYNYFVDNDYEVYADLNEFTGNKGIMAYNKTIQKKNTTNKLRDSSEWIIAVGKHPGIIKGSDWVRVQNMIERNRSKTFRKVKNSESLLSGILRCGNCGSFMRPKMGRVNKDGIQAFYYICELKEKSKREKCNIKNIKGNDLDQLVIDELKKLSYEGSTLSRKIEKDRVSITSTQSSLKTEIDEIKASIDNNDKAIANLINSLSEGQESSAAKYIINQIDELDKKNSKLKKRLLELKEKRESNYLKENDIEIIDDIMTKFATMIDTADVIQKRNLIRSVVDKIIWDGEDIDIVLFGADSKKKQ